MPNDDKQVSDGYVKPEWTPVHTVVVENVAITIKQSDHRNPRYSFDVQFIGLNGQPMRWANVAWSGEGKELKVKDISSFIAQATVEAQTWVEARMKEHYWNMRAEWETKKAQWEKKTPKLKGTHGK